MLTSGGADTITQCTCRSIVEQFVAADRASANVIPDNDLTDADMYAIR